MSNVDTSALLISKAEFVNPSKYMELVDKDETLGNSFSERSNSFSLSTSPSPSSDWQSLAIQPNHAKRSPYDLSPLDPLINETNVRKINEILDTCLLDNQLVKCSNSNPTSTMSTTATHQETSFTCKICLSKFTLASSKSIVCVNKSALLYLCSYSMASSSSSSLNSACSSIMIAGSANAESSKANKALNLLENEEKDKDDNRVFQIESCKCKFCMSCLNLYIKQSIKNFNVSPLHCPDSKCGAKGFLSRAEIKYLLDGSLVDNTFIGDINDNLVLAACRPKNSELFEKYLKICENIEILRNPNMVHCPQPNCENVCIISQSNEPNQWSHRNVKVSCDKCRHEFCSTCFKKWGDEKIGDLRRIGPSNDKSYDDEMISSIVADDAPLNTSIFLEKSPVIVKKSNNVNIHSHDDDEICLCGSHEGDENDNEALSRQKSLFDNLENIKRCPKCSVLIEKADGCAQIMCKMCKHTFCFYCLTSLDNDFLLKHYTKNGPCKGKLGHSRLSLLFHRFSVIAIFGGTILLIILLSPFLLLSLPCLVFSRKFRKSCFKLSSKFG